MASTVQVPPTVPEITPEKLNVFKIKHSAGIFESDDVSEPASPAPEYRSIDHLAHGNGYSRGLSSASSITRRHISRHGSFGSRRHISFAHSHRSQMSMELSSKADSKFSSLMNLMSTASREAASLKDTWSLITSERETLARENQELLERVEDITEMFEQKEKEHHHHGHELSERKRQVEKLILQLSSTFTEVTNQKKMVADRDLELNRIRTELQDLHAVHTRHHGHFDKTKAELEAITIKLRAAEDDRDHAKEDCRKHHSEHRNLLREYTELKGRYSESSTKLETSRKENSSLSERIRIWELERDEQLHEKDKLEEELKRAKRKGDDACRELSELTEKYERTNREYAKFKDSLNSLESERDDYALQIRNLRHEIKAKSNDLEETEEHLSDIKLKYDHIKRDVVSTKDKLREVEMERTELRNTVDRSLEENRAVVIDRDQLKEDLTDERRKTAEVYGEMAILREALRRSELTVTEVRSEMHSVSERNKALILEREEGQHKHGEVSKEFLELQAKIAQAKAEIRTITDSRDQARRELKDWKHEHDKMIETITTYRDDSGELEFEIQSLRTLLRDVRDQKERAISARHAADRERDEYVSKYEEKCREMERFEESVSTRCHGYSGSGSGSKSFSRTVSSGTTIRNSGN